MQYSTLALASAIILFAVYTVIMSFKSPDELIKLKYMRGKLGATTGTIVHTLAYVIVPLIFGAFMLNAGLSGVSITQFITGK